MSLRMIELVVESAPAEDVATLHEAPGVLAVWREQHEDKQVLLRFLVRSDRTESVINELQTRFEMSPDFRLVIFEVAATLPQPEDEEESKEENEDQSKEKPQEDSQRIACAELVEKLSQAAIVNRLYVVTVVLSTIVAAIGLIRDDVAIIIGAMVIAPLLGPNMTLALATTLGDLKLARRALKGNVAGMTLAFVVAVLIGVVVGVDPSNREIASRVEVSLGDIVLGLAAGSAGALAFTSGLSSALVGVMVAVALLPPLASAGLLLGSEQPQLAFDALLLTTTNIVSINVAAAATFAWQRVTPRQWWEADRARRMFRIAGGIWLGLLALLIFLILFTQNRAF